MSEHTGEEWEHTGRLIYSKEGMICELSDPRASKYVAHKRLSLNSPDWDEAMSNGQLIQAAPKLLKVCKALYSIVLNGMTEDYDNMTACLGEARAAIAKATGETQDANDAA